MSKLSRAIKRMPKGKKILAGFCLLIVLASFATGGYLFLKEREEKPLDKIEVDQDITINQKLLATQITKEFNEDYAYCLMSVALDKSYVFSPHDHPIIPIPWSLEDGGTEKGELELYKIKDEEEYIYLINKETIDIKDLELLKKYEIEATQDEEEPNRAATFEISENLEKGYYLAKYSIGDCQDVITFIMISNLSVYVGNTEREILVWVIDNNTGKPLQDAIVAFEEEIIKTDKDGLAKITNLKNEKETYRKYLKVATKDDELLVLVNNYNSENYYDSFVYSDKPIYKPNDTVFLWGYTPIDLYIDDIDYSKFKIVDGKNEYPVSLSDTGIFTTKYTLNNKSTGQIEFYYKDKMIENFSFEIANYTKPKIEYKVTTDKNNYTLKDIMTLTLSANTLTGEGVPNKPIFARFHSMDYSCTTDEDGTCEIRVLLEGYRPYLIDDYNELVNLQEEIIYISPNKANVSPAEENEIYDDDGTISTAKVNIIYNDIELSVNRVMQGNDSYYYDFTTKKISIENDTIVYTNIDHAVKVDILETICSKSRMGTSHLYEWTCDIKDQKEKKINTNNYKTKNGKLTVKDLNYLASLKYTSSSATETNYTLKFYVLDEYNHRRVLTLPVPFVSIDNYYYTENVSSYDLATFKAWCEGFCSGYYPISAYKNLYENINLGKQYHINEVLPITMYKNSSTKINANLKLSYFFKENIIETMFNKENTEFKSEYFPGVNIGGSYYNEEENTMNLTKIDYLDFNELDRKVDIKLSVDKNSYEPNDEVTLNIEVTDIEGRGVKVDTLISVVDESIFLISEDRNEEIKSIYNDKNFPFYQFATYQPVPFVAGGDGDDTDGYGGLKNGDTIYFENIKTDSNGKASVKFKLNDLETKFRITAISTNKDLYFGTNRIKITSKNK